MNKKFIKKIQKRVMDLLLTLSDNLQIAAKDQCSEIARLVGCWILDECFECKVQVCKGELSDESAHDILAIECNKKLFLIDPTIWQKFPKSKSIFIGPASDMQEALSLLNKKYNGSWKISEIMGRYNENYQQELLMVIKNNRKKYRKIHAIKET